MHRVHEEDAGIRIDNLLLRELRGIPRSRIYSMLRKGEVRVDGRRARPTRRLAAGEQVRIPPVRRQRRAADGEVSPGLRRVLEDSVLHEDAALLVVNKPAGLAVHGGSGVASGLVESLRVLRPDVRSLELAHRIDRDTSGCVLLAKKRSALRRLHRALAERTARKDYLAWVAGDWPIERTRLDAPLLRVTAANGERFVRASKEGKPSLTRVERLRSERGATLLRLHPETGRTHQIRVHLADAGHPILGDTKYADANSTRLTEQLGVSRMLLHAERIAVPWPEDGAEQTPERMLEFLAPVPDAFTLA